MTTRVTLESIHTLLTGFTERQDVQNQKVDAFIVKQEAFNSKQEAFNARLEGKLDNFIDESRAHHTLSHQMITQSFGYISDIRSELDDLDEPWKARKIKKTPV